MRRSDLRPTVSTSVQSAHGFSLRNAANGVQSRRIGARPRIIQTCCSILRHRSFSRRSTFVHRTLLYAHGANGLRAKLQTHGGSARRLHYTTSHYVTVEVCCMFIRKILGSALLGLVLTNSGLMGLAQAQPHPLHRHWRSHYVVYVQRRPYYRRPYYPRYHYRRVVIVEPSYWRHHRVVYVYGRRYYYRPYYTRY
jgi:hypothetical protein